MLRYFSGGEKRLSADWAGNERWQYDFTIQMAGFAFQERERMENAATAERFSRWMSENGAKKWIPAERERMESLWTGQGHLLYPARDGQTFVYEMAGRLIYWRKRTDAVPQRHWFFAFESIEERSWLECAEGIVKIEEKGMENTWLFDLSGRKRGTETAAGEIVFTGWLCPQDPFQNRALRQDAQQAVQWVCCSEESEAADAGAEGGLCYLQVQRIFETEDDSSKIRIRMQPLTREKGTFYQDTAGNRDSCRKNPAVRRIYLEADKQIKDLMQAGKSSDCRGKSGEDGGTGAEGKPPAFISGRLYGKERAWRSIRKRYTPATAGRKTT